MSHVAVVLSGCGVYDGSEIHEATLTLLHLRKHNLTYQCYAPDQPFEPTNHLTQQAEQTQRNLLHESARIARGNILPLTDLNTHQHDALLFPGGFGVAKHLSNYATHPTTCQVLPEIIQLIREYKTARKPLGFICISPVLAAQCLEGVHLTLGDDPALLSYLKAHNNYPSSCTAKQICLDPSHPIVSTPAYMNSEDIADIDHGIGLLVQQIARWLDHN